MSIINQVTSLLSLFHKMGVKTKGGILLLFTVFMSVTAFSQSYLEGEIPDSVKTLDFKVYTVKVKKGKITKGKPIGALAHEYYPVKYPFIKSYFDSDGRIVKTEGLDQTDTFCYNTESQLTTRVLYPVKSNDSITIAFIYDAQGNIAEKKMNSSAPEMDYRLDGNYYSYKSLIDTKYRNYYLSEADSGDLQQFRSRKPELHTYYRLFNDKNELIQEKYLVTTATGLPHQKDSTFYTITYKYNKESEVSNILTVRRYVTSIGTQDTSSSSENHIYSDHGLIHEINYFDNNGLYRTERIIKNSSDVIKERTDHWFSPDRLTTYSYNDYGDLKTYKHAAKGKVLRDITIEYTYNSREDWISCVHYDRKGKPKYLIERIIEYY